LAFPVPRRSVFLKQAGSFFESTHRSFSSFLPAFFFSFTQGAIDKHQQTGQMV
jgi:hypothetical protein